MILRKKRGVTFIELLIATAVISFAILGSINLLTRVYRDITSASMKTDSINIASEQIELLRSKEFTALGITPDSCITSDLGSLESCADNPHPVETIHHKSRDFKIYKIIQYCEEDSDGNLEPKKESQLSYSNPRNLKQIKVIVTYDDMQMNKTTELASFITNKEVPIAGTTISGRIYKKSTGGQSQPPGQASMATVYVVGHPEYTSRQYDDRGNYTLKNVQPGTYMLYASGLGFETTYYENNPIIVTDAVQEITDVDFLCEPVETAAIEGNVFIPSYAGSEKLLLNAAGSMTGQTSQWTNPLNIKESDDLYASISQNNRRLYTSFETYSETYSTITDVKLHIEHYSDGYSAGDSIGVQFTNDNGSTWASTSGPDPNPWNGNQNTNYTTFNMSASETTEIINITDLYENWSWDDINTLGLALRTQSSRMHYMDHAFLEIDYDKYDIDLMDNTIVMSHDGLSEKAEAGSDGAYKIENIDVSGGDVLITATSSHPSACYYKEIEDVPVTAGQTTNLDIILEECPPGVSILTGSVYDAIDKITPLNGVNVFLTTSLGVPIGITETTTGGGSYTMNNIEPGSYKLDAAAPGYTIEEKHTISIYSGTVTAPPIYMVPVGSISGKVTKDSTSEPMSGMTLKLYTRTGQLVDTKRTTVTGYYKFENVKTDNNYRVEYDKASSDYDCIYPVTKYHFGINVIQGTDIGNKDFIVKQEYAVISGKIQVEDADMKEGIMIAAYPSGSGSTAHSFYTDNSDAALQYQTLKIRKQNPFYARIGKRNAEFSVNVPMGQNYNIYAYYTDVEYSQTQPFTKTMTHYYKVETNVSPGTSDIVLGGPLNSWTKYGEWTE